MKFATTSCDMDIGCKPTTPQDCYYCSRLGTCADKNKLAEIYRNTAQILPKQENKKNP